jgi:hypothetical protein
LVEEFSQPLEYQNISCFVTPKSGVPKLYSTPFFCDAAGVVYITKFYHYLGNHYIMETITKLPATAELPLPPLHCCCCRRTAAMLPKALPPSASLSIVCVVVHRLLCCLPSALLSGICIVIHCLHQCLGGGVVLCIVVFRVHRRPSSALTAVVCIIVHCLCHCLSSVLSSVVCVVIRRVRCHPSCASSSLVCIVIRHLRCHPLSVSLLEWRSCCPLSTSLSAACRLRHRPLPGLLSVI